MYIKINDQKKSLKFFNKSHTCIIFSFVSELSSEILTVADTIELYSDDDIFLNKYNLVDYTVEINVNDLILKNPSIPKDIDTYKQEKVAMTKQLLADWLKNNPILYTDGKYYSVTEEKQALLNGNLSSYERATNTGIPYPLKWNSTGEECVDWEYADLIALSLSIAGYVAPKVSKQQAYELQIKACGTVEEVNEIVISYD